MSRKIIIDTDPGVDDAMAIFYALKSPELEVLGLTTVFGNVTTDICTTNALRLLEIAGRADLPVSEGAHRPLACEYHGTGDVVHGEDGQGNTHLPPPTHKPSGIYAANYIIQQVMAAPGQVTIVALGPLTNVALALLLEPRLAANIQEIVIMGGAAFATGNLSSAREANIDNDPEAADTVFAANCPITMCGLDVTEKTVMSTQELERIGTFDNPLAQHLARILPHYHNFYKSFLGLDGIFVHDSTTISYLLAPQCYRSVQLPVCVETSQGVSRGKTWPGQGGLRDAGSPWESRRSVNILVEVDAAAVIRMELERLAK
jgi:inosine-uridine nucleoside N-ribohydrolase